MNIELVMKRVIDSSEILGTVDTSGGASEVCATACAEYDPETSRLAVKLDSFLRTTDIRAKEQRFTAVWLPNSEVVTESVGLGEAPELAREIFHRWVRKVRPATPMLHNQTI